LQGMVKEDTGKLDAAEERLVIERLRNLGYI
jgi:hypothetical protein